MMGSLSSKYIGEWKKDRKVRGKQIDNQSNKEFTVEYDADKDFKNGINFNKQVPVSKY